MSKGQPPSVAVPDRLRGPVFADTDGHRTVVWLSGRHDASTVAALSQAAADAIADDGVELVFDLRNVDFMDASTVAVITRIDQRLRQRSRSLVIRAPSTFARLVLDPYGLKDFVEPDPRTLRPAPSEEAALRSWVAIPPTERLASFVEVEVPDLANSGTIE